MNIGILITSRQERKVICIKQLHCDVDYIRRAFSFQTISFKNQKDPKNCNIFSQVHHSFALSFQNGFHSRSVYLILNQLNEYIFHTSIMLQFFHYCIIILSQLKKQKYTIYYKRITQVYKDFPSILINISILSRTQSVSSPDNDSQQ